MIRLAPGNGAVSQWDACWRKVYAWGAFACAQGAGWTNMHSPEQTLRAMRFASKVCFLGAELLAALSLVQFLSIRRKRCAPSR